MNPNSCPCAELVANSSFRCNLPGLEGFIPGQYAGVTANYLSFATPRSTPHLPERAKEFEACTGGRIVFSEAANIFEDPVQDMGTRMSRGSEVYDAYFMGYSHFPEVSALDLAEPLNDRIRDSNDKLKWEDMLPKVRLMAEYRKEGKTSLEFLPYDGDFFVPFIRTDLLEKFDLPLPNTWDEVLQYARFFNGTDLNGDGSADDDFGFCHFPRAGAGHWDWWWPELIYSTWATTDQTSGIQQGFFFDVDTMEPRLTEGFRYAVSLWKELWGLATSSGDSFIEGRCAIGFAPPGEWKQAILTPDGVSRKDANGNVVWRPTMKDGSYAEPYRSRPFGSINVVDRESGMLVLCTPELCTKTEHIPSKGHHGKDDRANSIVKTSPLTGQLINRAPFYWSGGLGTVIRKSSSEEKKDLIWDFFVYTNSPEKSVNDVASYASWLDSWRFSQLQPGDNFRAAGWSEQAYKEHVSTMQWALSNEVNGAFNLRLPGTAHYTRDVVGEQMARYIDSSISLEELVKNVREGWNEVTRSYGKLEQLEIYRASLGLDASSSFDLCRLHRELMDKRDPSVCVKFDPKSSSSLMFVATIPAALIIGTMLAYWIERRRRSSTSFVIPGEEIRLDLLTPANGRFGVILADYHGSRVALYKLRTAQKRKSETTSEETPEAHPGVAPRSNDIETGKPAVSNEFGNRSGFLFQLKALVPSSANAHFPSRLTEEVQKLSKLRHPCLATVLGATLKNGEQMLVTEYTDQGSLHDLIHNDTIVIEGEVLLPILRDVAQGMRFLHAANPQVLHGHLRSACILVDSRFRAKITGFDRFSTRGQVLAGGSLFWTAPEILRGDSQLTPEADVYSFGVLLTEVYARSEPYNGENTNEVIRLVADPVNKKRPAIPSSCPTKVQQLITECFDEAVHRRPTFEELDLQLKRLDAEIINPENIQSTKQVRTNELLLDLFPRHVAEALRDGRAVEPESRDLVTICFSDIVGFTEISSTMSAAKVSNMLGRLYSKFDALSTHHDVFKVETIGDAYMSVTNLAKNQSDHAKRIVDFARGAIIAANNTLIDPEDSSKGHVAIRVGIHSGPVVATVVGSRNPRYCLFGDTVNTASRIESASEVNRIHCSKRTAMLLKDQDENVDLVSRGLIKLKGKGRLEGFWVGDEDNSHGIIHA